MGRTPRGMLSNHGSSAIPVANEATDVGTRDQLIGRKLRTRWPDDNNFYEAVIVDYNPVQVCYSFVWLNWEKMSFGGEDYSRCYLSDCISCGHLNQLVISSSQVTTS